MTVWVVLINGHPCEVFFSEAKAIAYVSGRLQFVIVPQYTSDRPE